MELKKETKAGEKERKSQNCERSGQLQTFEMKKKKKKGYKKELKNIRNAPELPPLNAEKWQRMFND